MYLKDNLHGILAYVLVSVKKCVKLMNIQIIALPLNKTFLI